MENSKIPYNFRFLEDLFATLWSFSAKYPLIHGNEVSPQPDKSAATGSSFTNGLQKDEEWLAVRLQPSLAQSYRSMSQMKAPSVDRRAFERFDVLGSLWGQLELPETATVLNVSSAGLLVEAMLCPVLGSVQTVRMLVDGDSVSADAVVRHRRPGRDGRQVIGLEFLSVPTTVLAAIALLASHSRVEVIDSEASRS